MPNLTWTDAAGHLWSCAIRLSDARRLKESGTDLFNPEQLRTLFSDTLGTIELIGELLRPQWEEAGISYLDFSDSLVESAGVYTAATAALQAAIADFFRRIDRPALALVVERAFETARSLETQAVGNAGGDKMAQLMTSMQRRSQAAFDEEIEKAIAEQSITTRSGVQLSKP